MTLGIFNPWSNDMEEISNKGLSRLLSVEVMGSMLVTAFIVGVTYSSLASDVKSGDAELMQVKQEVKKTTADVSSIKTDIAVVKTTQGHLQDDIEEQGEQLDEIDRDVKQILRILSETYDD